MFWVPYCIHSYRPYSSYNETYGSYRTHITILGRCWTKVHLHYQSLFYIHVWKALPQNYTYFWRRNENQCLLITKYKVCHKIVRIVLKLNYFVTVMGIRGPYFPYTTRESSAVYNLLNYIKLHLSSNLNHFVFYIVAIEYKEIPTLLSPADWKMK